MTAQTAAGIFLALWCTFIAIGRSLKDWAAKAEARHKEEEVPKRNKGEDEGLGIVFAGPSALTDFKVTKTAAGKNPKTKAKSKSGKVEVTRVKPSIMKAALKAAGGDASRIVIKGPNRVEILDARYGRKKK